MIMPLRKDQKNLKNRRFKISKNSKIFLTLMVPTKTFQNLPLKKLTNSESKMEEKNGFGQMTYIPKAWSILHI